MSRDRSKARAAAWLLGVAVALAFPSAALAAGKTVNVGTPFENGPPAIAVNNSGEALVAWANTEGPRR